MKICLIGDVNAGKTTICNNLLNKNRERTTTIGLEYNSLKVGDTNFELFDTAGQERYRCLIPMYLRKAEIIIFVLSSDNITDELLNYWYNYIEDNSCCRKILIIITKCDLLNVSNEKIELINCFFNKKTIIKKFNNNISNKIKEFLLKNIKKKPREIDYDYVNEDLILNSKSVNLITGENVDKYDFVNKKPKCCK